ncbi:lipase class 3 family protein [Agrocybe pediades]|nr:lipase class 3 family protein [Agrocybe pediades]
MQPIDVFLPILLFLTGAVLAAPAAIPAPSGLVDLGKRQRPGQGISILTTAEVHTFRPFTYFASTAYCQPENTLAWNCGANCLANPDFIPTASGGNGSTVQFWYVGYSPSEAAVVVAHQGTDVQEIEAVATDLDLIQTILDQANFPGISPTVRVHRGFYEAHARSAAEILAAVRQTIRAHGARRIVTVGHSLGAALALLDGVFLPLHIREPGIEFESITYGMPRVGNQVFADYVDSNLNLRHIANKKDPIPTVPPRFLNYRNPAGEIHITENNDWVHCPGQDNPSTLCIVGDVPNIFEGSRENHSGPFDGIVMDC